MNRFKAVFPTVLWNASATIMLGSVIGLSGAVNAAKTSAVSTTPATADLSVMAASIVPGNDFNGYANGQWMKKTEIPADRASYGAYAVLAELNRKRVLEILESAAKVTQPGDPELRAIADYFASFMDEAAIDKKGIEPLRNRLTEITAISDRSSLSRVLGERLRADVDALNSTNFHTPNLLGSGSRPT